MTARKKKSKPTCTCIDKMNAHLKPKGYRLELGVAFVRNEGLSKLNAEVYPMLRVERAPDTAKPRGQLAPMVAASFCPFCGTMYVRGASR